MEKSATLKSKKESDIKDQIKSCLESIQHGRNSPSKEKKVLRQIRKIKCCESEELAVNAAQWVIIYHLNNINKCESTEQAKSLIKNSKSDFKHILKLLERPYEKAEYEQTAILLTADLSQKLSDFPRLHKAYRKIIVLSRSLPQLVTLVLSLAPTLGDWRSFYQYVQQLERHYNRYSSRGEADLSESLHQMTENGMPDIGVLYRYTKERQLHRLATPAPDKLFQQTVEIERVELHVKKVVADSPEREQEIREQFEREKDNEFNTESINLSVNGAVLIVPGFSLEVPQLLYGAYCDSEALDVEGYIDMQLQETDEEGNPKGNLQSPQIGEEILNSLPPHLIEAINSGEFSPDMLMEALAQFNMLSPAAKASMENSELDDNALPDDTALKAMNPELRRSFMEFARSFSEKGSEMMKKYGLSLVRQQERLQLRKTEGGYEGTYVVKNYNPNDSGDMTSLELEVKLFCEHLNKPTLELKDVVEEIEAGVDGLVLD